MKATILASLACIALLGAVTLEMDASTGRALETRAAYSRRTVQVDRTAIAYLAPTMTCAAPGVCGWRE